MPTYLFCFCILWCVLGVFFDHDSSWSTLCDEVWRWERKRRHKPNTYQTYEPQTHEPWGYMGKHTGWRWRKNKTTNTAPYPPIMQAHKRLNVPIHEKDMCFWCLCHSLSLTSFTSHAFCLLFAHYHFVRRNGQNKPSEKPKNHQSSANFWYFPLK